jgi:hypothetical protein
MRHSEGVLGENFRRDQDGEYYIPSALKPSPRLIVQEMLDVLAHLSHDGWGDLGMGSMAGFSLRAGPTSFGMDDHTR